MDDTLNRVSFPQVEDDSFAGFVAQTLLEAENHTVEVIPSGAAAINRLSAEKFNERPASVVRISSYFSALFHSRC